MPDPIYAAPLVPVSEPLAVDWGGLAGHPLGFTRETPVFTGRVQEPLSRNTSESGSASK
ncbi:hypothetical protein BJ988_000473 [Nocardioides panzhihuensis]|uniref:Uncharacterized protein n=1 Tax=Nocardioides panzhihuensis TaxID=860243 RepID=A0A7Z0DI78_9ACTN|nr:hypothetical protein [Nocardioides panzhihuensis]